jgi:hypothetical protein
LYRKLLALDFDNTLALTDERIIQVFTEEIPGLKIGERVGYDYSTLFPTLQSNEITRLIWETHKHKIWSLRYLLPDFEYLKFLTAVKSLGIDIWIVTSNSDIQFIKDWIDFWIPSNWILDLRYSRTKQEHRVDYLIDDDLDVIKNFQNTGRQAIWLKKQVNSSSHLNQGLSLMQTYQVLECLFRRPLVTQRK